jgi:xylulokinase
VPIYLGLDSSTQSLTATAIETPSTRSARSGQAGPRRQILFERTLNFDDELRHYGTRHGVLPSGDPQIAHAPPLMWAEALDRMMARLVRDADIDWQQLRAISGSAQQHGSVYLNATAGERLRTLEPGRPLVERLGSVLSRHTSPIWMDSSTTAQCAAIEALLGGPRGLAHLTGSRAFERFTGPQIRKFADDDPAGYAATDRVHLVSSWMASLLAGRHAPIDPGDGSGMNLMDLAARQWSADAVRATAPGLAAKLPALAESWTVVGPLSPYWTTTYGLPPASVIAWSGDNPCSLVGTGLVREGLVAISLGTSDTIFGLMSSSRPSEDGTGMTVFKNGSLARERVRDEFHLDWPGFAAALRQTRPAAGAGMMLPWFEPEITPLVLKPGVRRYGIDPADGPANVRAIVESQMMALALHSRWMGAEVSTIYATGGAAASREILQVMADVFDAEVFQLQSGNSAALGAALRACHADRMADRQPISWEEVVSGFAEPRPDSRIVPVRENVVIYRALIEEYAAREAQALRSANTQ